MTMNGNKNVARSSCACRKKCTFLMLEFAHNLIFLFRSSGSFSMFHFHCSMQNHAIEFFNQIWDLWVRTSLCALTKLQTHDSFFGRTWISYDSYQVKYTNATAKMVLPHDTRASENQRMEIICDSLLDGSRFDDVRCHDLAQTKMTVRKNYGVQYGMFE